ncbi:MAG: hypothetical protein ACREOB_04135 [Thermodesulfobacteriota bacterium]
MYLCVDPGTTTGFAIFDDDGALMWMGEKDVSRLEEWLNSLGDNFHIVIIEEYRLYPHIPQIYSRIETVQVIGRVKSWAHKRDIRVIEQPAQMKNIGYKFLGRKQPSRKEDTHRWDAYAHGAYYLQTRGIRNFVKGQRHEPKESEKSS